MGGNTCVWLVNQPSGLAHALSNRLPEARIESICDLAAFNARLKAPVSAPDWVFFGQTTLAADTELLLASIHARYPASSVAFLEQSSPQADRRRLTLSVPHPAQPRSQAYAEAFIALFAAMPSHPESYDARDGAAHTENLVRSFAAEHGLSSRQADVLRLHWEGRQDKEIAGLLGNAPATVHEHWRRMASKLNLRTKADVLSEFRRFLSKKIGAAIAQSEEVAPHHQRLVSVSPALDEARRTL